MQNGPVHLDPDREWTPEEVPVGPYLHGSRKKYEPGDLLLTDVINTMPGEEDERLMCFAIVSLEHALDWAYRRGIRHGGEIIYVYEVEMDNPKVDVNMHRPGAEGPVTSVMSPKGRVVKVAVEIPVADYPHAFFG